MLYLFSLLLRVSTCADEIHGFIIDC